MKALVTGSTGIVGANLVTELRRRSWKVRVLVRKNSDTSPLLGTGAELVYGDILDPASLDAAAKGCSIVFHCAAIFSYSGRSSDEILTTARKGTENVIIAAAKAGSKRVVLTASSVVLGSSRTPIVIDEAHPGSEPPVSIYEQSKIEQLHCAIECAKKQNIELVCTCPTLCVGPRDKRLSEGNAVITNFLRDPLRATWLGGVNLVSIQDVAIGHVLIAEKGKPGDSYLLGADNITWESVHTLITELCGIAGPYIHVNHTTTYIAALMHELSSFITGERPLVSRPQAKMVGRYYWYASGKAGALGYNPRSTRQALIETIAWLSTSNHITPSLRASLRLSDDVLSATGTE